VDLIDLVARWGMPLVLAAVLLEQAGLPLGYPSQAGEFPHLN